MADNKKDKKEKKEKKKKQKGELSKYIAQRRSYIIGIILGVMLILVNSGVGIYVVSLVLSSQNPQDLEFEALPVPKISTSDYEQFRDDHLDRQAKDLIIPSSVDPFDTTGSGSELNESAEDTSERSASSSALATGLDNFMNSYY